MKAKQPPKRSSRSSRDLARHVICVENRGYEASLEKSKVYRTKLDASAAREHLIRVVDESGEDYLYPSSLFRPIRLTLSIRQALGLTA